MVDDMGAGEAVLDADFIALEDEVLVDRFIRGVCRMNDEVDRAPLRAADHGHHVLQLHIDRVNRFVRALSDRENAVAGMEALVEVRRTSGDDFFNRGIAVIRLEDSSYSFDSVVDGL